MVLLVSMRLPRTITDRWIVGFVFPKPLERNLTRFGRGWRENKATSGKVVAGGVYAGLERVTNCAM